MNKLDHTPGPWEAVSTTVRTKRDADGGGGYFVAECFPPIGCEVLQDDREAEAKARFIAAAPDMLEALIAMHGYLVAVDVVGMDHPKSAGNIFLKEIDSLIERATGKTIEEVLKCQTTKP
jgi:hypothetical protein